MPGKLHEITQDVVTQFVKSINATVGLKDEEGNFEEGDNIEFLELADKYKNSLEDNQYWEKLRIIDERKNGGNFWIRRTEIKYLLTSTSASTVNVREACPNDKDDPWSYNLMLKNGPEYWGETFKQCNGLQQSPINIRTADCKLDRDLRLQLTNYEIPITYFEIANNGKTVNVTPLDGVTRSVIINEVPHNLIQFHFHWGDMHNSGSEHTLNGKQYVMEIHFVHQSENKEIAIVGLFLQSSLFSNKVLAPITDYLKRIQYRGYSEEIKGNVNLDKLINNCSFYRYNGSLTTPGCDEGAIWSMCKNLISIGFLQISEFRKLYSTTTSGEELRGCKITNNIRPTQSLNGRIVACSE